MKRLAFSIGFVSLCAWLAIYANPPSPERVATYRVCGKQMPESCVDFKGAK